MSPSPSRGLVWHPCRDARGFSNPHPVVSLRSTTGYTLGCLRHISLKTK